MHPTQLTRDLDVRCKMCKEVGGAYCDECAVAVAAVRDLWVALEEIADAPAPPTGALSAWMQSKAREALGRSVWTNA